MKLKARQKVSVAIILISVVLAFCVYLVVPDQVLTGYRIENGVESIIYVHKAEGFWTIILIPLLCSLVWDIIGEWNDRKLLEEPELQSYRIRKVLINVIFFFGISMGIVVAVINLMLCL